MSKMWGGRFTRKIDRLVLDFHSSLPFDRRLYKYDILGSIAHARMLGETGIIEKKEAEKIIACLEELSVGLERGDITLPEDAEDVHMAVEQLLTERTGDVGKKLHTARSRNDQVALDVRLYLMDEIKEITRLLAILMENILDLSFQHLDTIMPGYTHLQRAQPVTLAHHLMAYFNMFARDADRLLDAYGRTDIMPLGSGALAGTTFPIDRGYVARELGFTAISENSLDAVADRDFAVEFTSAAALIMVHLSRFCEEIVIWASTEFAFVELDDAYSTGSSMMPQKKNPDVAELIRGKSGRVFGSLMSLLTVLKGLPLAYNKDMQEDKEVLFDTVDTVKKCLVVFSPLLLTTRFKKDRLSETAGLGYTNATDLADYLVRRGVPFRRAHEIVGGAVLYCTENQKALGDLALEEFRTLWEGFEEDVYEAISLQSCVEARKVSGGPAPEAVKAAIEQGRQVVDRIKGRVFKNS